MISNKQEIKKPVKHGKSRFKKLIRLIFVEDWGLKVLAICFAVAVWVIFKVS